ncbi:hypothetical protein J4417_04880 [Candidatus Woesearchaeota archaeon]|nr:hypothetical protein [Candidatus Woesearchaeota archaeon]
MKDDQLTLVDMFRVYAMCQPTEKSKHEIEEGYLMAAKRIERLDEKGVTFEQLLTNGFKRGELGGLFSIASMITQEKGDPERAEELFLTSISYYALEGLYEDAARTVLRMRMELVEEAVKKCKAIGQFECADYITVRSKK